MKRILLFSSLCKSSNILNLTIDSWMQQQSKGYRFDILLYDDNTDKKASSFVRNLVLEHDSINILPQLFNSPTSYENHFWKEDSFARITAIKNKAIQYTIENGYDGIFLVDADLILHRNTLSHLLSLEKDFVFEIFWTVFHDQLFAKPNCWDVHPWDYYSAQTMFNLREKGTFPIGAGGACTLISREALLKGLSFEKIKNLPYGGEDRHFCTRAEALGLEIFVDTHFPAYHIFKEELLDEASSWYSEGCNPDFFQTWLGEEWEQFAIEFQIPNNSFVPKNKFEKIMMALYKAKRAYINYLRYN